jgi:hypothetical protein
MMMFLFAVVLFIIGAVLLFAVVNPYFRERHLYIFIDFKYNFWGSLWRMGALVIGGLGFLIAAVNTVMGVIQSGFFR